MEDLGKLFAQLSSSGVAGPDDIEGCTPTELAGLEKRFGVHLPATYRFFLERMGHSAGALFTHDHVETSFSEVVEWTEKLRAHSLLRLPNDAVVISARLGDQFEFIKCSDGDDPIVWYVAQWEPREVLKSHGSVREWLLKWAAEAEEARRSGHHQRVANRRL